MTKNKKQKNTLFDSIERALKEVEPKNSWHFVLHNFLFWTFGIIAVIFGASAFAVVIYTMKHSGQDLSIITYGSTSGHLIHILPYLWFVSLGIFWISAQKLICLTDCGYRFNIKKVFLTLIGTSLILGAVLDLVRAGDYLDQRAGEMIPFHKPLRVIHQADWTAADHGRLGGTLLGEMVSQRITLQGFDEKIWHLDLSENGEMWKTEFQSGDNVRMIGMLQDGNTFYVCGMHSWIFESSKRSQSGQSRKDILENSRSERKIIEARSNLCKGLEEKYSPPYQEKRLVPQSGN